MSTNENDAETLTPSIKLECRADTKDAAEVANRFLDKLSGAIGMLYEPIHTVRTAKAETKSLIIRTETEAKLPAIRQRALERFLAEETRKQENLESTIEQAKKLLAEDAKPEAVADDWLLEWAERAAKVSDKDMQELWARILAGEANAPRSFRKSALHVIAMLEREDAEGFRNLCRFVVNLAEPTPLVLNVDDAVYSQQGITFTSLQYLEAAGLLAREPLGYVRRGLPQIFAIMYGPMPLRFEMAAAGQELKIGKVRFTPVGQQLFALNQSQIIAEFPQYIADHYASMNIKVMGAAIKPKNEVPREAA